MGGEAKGKLFEISILQQLKKNYSLIPIAFIAVFGMSLSIWQMGRTLLRSPDVCINRPNNPKPYEKFYSADGKAIQYKYFSTLDYNKLPNEKPTL